MIILDNDDDADSVVDSDDDADGSVVEISSDTSEELTESIKQSDKK